MALSNMQCSKQTDVLPRSILSLWACANLAFCLIWALAVLAFPYMKGMWIGYVPVALGMVAAVFLLSPKVRTAVNGRLNRPSNCAFLAWVVGVGLFLRLLTLLLWPMELGSDSAACHRVALRLLAGQGYGETAYWPPAFPALLAIWYRVTAPHPLAAYILGVLLGTAAIPLGYDVGRRALSPLGARWTALLIAITPTLVFTSYHVHTSSTSVLVVLATLNLVLITAEHKRGSWWPVIGLGVLLGFGSLLKSTFLLVPLLVLCSWLVLGLGRKAVSKFAATALIAACIVTPWIVRNYIVLGALVPVSTQGGECLYLGMNPESDGLWCPTPDRVRAQNGEIRADRILRAAALQWACDHPVECAKLIVRKQAYMWGTSSTNIAVWLSPRIPARLHHPLESLIKLVVNAFWTLLMVLCLASVLVSRVWREPKLFPGMLLVFYLFGVHLFYTVQSRYHIPIIPVLILVASAGMTALLPERSSRPRAVEPPIASRELREKLQTDSE